MDRLTMDKFIFLGPNSTPQDIKAVMIAAEKFIFENAEGGSMVIFTKGFCAIFFLLILKHLYVQFLFYR